MFKQAKTSGNNQSLLTPTPFISSQNNVPTITSVIPGSNAKDVAIFPAITVVFSRPLTTQEEAAISLSSSPTITGTQAWSSDQTTLLLTPTTPLQTNLAYKLTLLYFQKEYSWTFTTVPLSQVSTEDQIAAQAKADKSFGEWDKNNAQNYPWYNQLPIQASTYFVYFDLDNKKFIAKLYPTSSTPTDTEITALKNEVQTKLISLGVPLNDYFINWSIIPVQ